MVQYPCKQEIPPSLLDLLSLFFSFQNTYAGGAVCVASGSQNRETAGLNGSAVSFSFRILKGRIYPICQENPISGDCLGFLRRILVLNPKMGLGHIDILGDWNKI